MKYGIPVGTILLLGVAFCLHRSTVPGLAPRSTVTAVPPAGLAGHAESIEPLAVAQETRSPESVQSQKRSETAAPPKPDPASSWRKLFGTLDRDLRLSSIQQAAAEQILRDREREIRECHEAIRKSGVLDIRHYEWQVSLMKASWYQRIDALLEAVQHEQFVAIVEKGFFNDGLAFSYEPGMTVLD